MRNLFAALIVVAVGVTAAVRVGAQNAAPVRTIEGGVLDDIKLYADKLPQATTVVIRPFSATDTDLTQGENKEIKEETKKMQADAPRLLAERFVAKLKEIGPATNVSIIDGTAPAPAGALVVEGKFTEIDPGSRAKRYFVGFGAGKSGVTVEGSVKAADGALLATFGQQRIGVMGVAGGDSIKKLTQDAQTIGEDVAKFLNAWATGKKLK